MARFIFLRPLPYFDVGDAPSGRCRRAKARRARRRQRGFTLIELMAVIVIIGILAVAAAPSMHLTTFDRHAYNDAGTIMQLFRNAHARAISYAVPVVVAMTSNGTSDRGTFVTFVANSPVIGGTVVSCKAPFVWGPIATPLVQGSGNANLTAVDGLNLNGAPGTAEYDGNIQTTLNYYDTSATKGPHLTVAAAFMCFTPLGRSYVDVVAANTSSTALFDIAQPNVAQPNLFPLEVLVQRLYGGGSVLNRSVMVLPNGTARVFSHTW